MDRTATGWEQRYVTRTTPWDTGSVSDELRKRLTEQAITPDLYHSALDIGCGTGINALYLAQNGFRVSACDFSGTALAQARNRDSTHLVDWQHVDFLTHHWRQPPFDLMFDRGCYHTVCRMDLNALLDSLDRVSHPGTLFILLTGNADDPQENGPPTMSATELTQHLEGMFRLRDLRPFHFQLSPSPALTPLGWSSVWEKR